MPTQHPDAADTAQTACHTELGAPRSLGAVLLKLSALVTLGATCCVNSLCLLANSYLSGEVTTASWLGFTVPSSSLATILNLPSSTEKSNIPKSVSKNSYRVSVSAVVTYPFSNIAVQQRDTVASTATHKELLWLCSSTGKNVSVRLQLSPCVDGLEWAVCLLSYLIRC